MSKTNINNLKIHSLGQARIGDQRQLKFALEDYWAGKSSQSTLQEVAKDIRQKNWQLQIDNNLDFVTAGDFAFYDQVLNHSFLVGNVPSRFEPNPENHLDCYFRAARGRAPTGNDAPACDMTKWFDTNYHYIVPEINANTDFNLYDLSFFEQIGEAKQLGKPVKPVLLGPISYLWLSNSTDGTDRLSKLPQLIAVYNQIFARLNDLGIEWLQIDEPALVQDLPSAWLQAYESAFSQFKTQSVKLLLTTYFESISDQASLICNLPIDGLHIDAVRAPEQLAKIIDQLPNYKLLSLGIIDGRNIWANDINKTVNWITPLVEQIKNPLWLAPSCSLLHCPINLDIEQNIQNEIKPWLAFGEQKLAELHLVAQAIINPENPEVIKLCSLSADIQHNRANSPLVNNPSVKNRIAAIKSQPLTRQSNFVERQKKQKAFFNLPTLPTTTIGSFPQTNDIRGLRKQFKTNEIDQAQYEQKIFGHIEHVIREQEALDIDVLVHGEAERNDMVEYFGEQLDGFVFSQFGWVQSYGSRCVKPPIIYGDISRPNPMTVKWSSYAQSLTKRPVKGMLTGPITLLFWSFRRDDVSNETSCNQLAFAVQDEIKDLQSQGINIIQIDEPAIREGLPLKKAKTQAYLDWAVNAFKLATSQVSDETQIHTHMCYSQFNDIIESIEALDADVITIETSRSNMELLDAFGEKHQQGKNYPNEIGPGVYDIHSPQVPNKEWMTKLLDKALETIKPENLWVNPDCGLKTRGWPETKAALELMVESAKTVRKKVAEEV